MSNSNALSEIYFVVIVLSGKGGVGKSTVACNLALQIGNLNRSSVGVIDLDICGPSVPKIMGLSSESVLQSSSGWIPVTCECIVSSVSDSVSADSEPCPASATAHETFSISVVSIASMLEKEDDAIVWRGPRKEALIQQFIDQVVWPAGTKYLVIDTPPGTSDEHIMVLKLITEKMRTQHRLQIAAVLVSTPQTVSTDDVAKEISFCRKMNLPMIGVVENMTSYTCPHCNTETAIFGQGGCDKLTSHHKIPKLGQLCLNPNLSILQDRIGLLYYWRKNKTPPDGSLTGTRLADAKSSDAEFIAIAKKINHYFATLHNTNIS